MPRPEQNLLNNNMYDFDSLTVHNVPALWGRRDVIFKDKVFDMGQMRTIDSAGIAFLAQWALSLETKKLRILNLNKNAKALIQTFGVAELFDAQ